MGVAFDEGGDVVEGHLDAGQGGLGGVGGDVGGQHDVVELGEGVLGGEGLGGEDVEASGLYLAVAQELV